jgi:hypothetical protein
MNSNVLTPTGWKNIFDLKVRDRVCNPDGTLSEVSWVSEVSDKDTYRFTFIDDAVVETTADSLWAASESGRRSRRKKPKVEIPDGLDPIIEWNLHYIRNYKLISTMDVIRLFNVGQEKKEKGERPTWPLIPLTNPVSLSRVKNPWQILPPYTMGVLLGDGALSKNAVTWNKPDQEIAEFVSKELFYLDFPLKVSPRSDGETFGLIKRDSADDPAMRYLERVKLSGCLSETKFVPEVYKWLQVSDRFDITQGLMDTDGTADEAAHTSFTSTSKELALGVQFLLRSLGYTATMSDRIPTYTYEGQTLEGQRAYTLYIKGRDTHKLFRLPRKRSLVENYQYNGGDEWPKRRLIKVEHLGMRPSRKFQVTSLNGAYITDDFIVAHT